MPSSFPPTLRPRKTLRVLMGVACGLALGLAGCDQAPVVGTPLRVWHTFGTADAVLLNDELEAVAPGQEIEATLLPFGRAQNRIESTLAAHPQPHGDCPDLVRIDATWLPGLASAGLLRALVNDVKALDGIRPEAVELVAWNDRHWGLPQAIEPLALLADRERIAKAGIPWPPATPAALDGAIRKLTEPERPGLALRPDGYDVVAALRAGGADLLDPATGVLGVDAPSAAVALDALRMLATAGALAAPSGRDEVTSSATRLFLDRKAALLVAGPWTLGEVPGFPIDVAPWPMDADGRPTAPRGGHVYVVPRCASQPERAWRLAEALTTPAREAGWATRRGIVPTHLSVKPSEGLGAGFAAALAGTRPLPRHPMTPRLFDDLTPAVRAVLDGDATGNEALAGVSRAWRRLYLQGASGTSRVPAPAPAPTPTPTPTPGVSP